MSQSQHIFVVDDEAAARDMIGDYLKMHGFAVTLAGDLPSHVLLFGESASRVVVSVAPEREGSLRGLAATRGVPFERLGETGGPRAMIDGMVDTTVSELAEVWEGAIPRLLGETA